MKNLLVMALVCAGVNTLSAQSDESSRFTVGASVVTTYGDFRAFTNQSAGVSIEGTIDLTRGYEPIQFRFIQGVLYVPGKTRSEYGSKASLGAVRTGVDVTFKTPNENVVPYVGLVFTNWFDWMNTKGNVDGLDKSFTDRHAKLGFRVGVDYAVSRHVTLAADYNLSEWRHDSMISERPVRGLNPVNPSWMSLTARYRF